MGFNSGFKGLKQKSIKQMGVKMGLAYRHALLDSMEQPSLEGSRFSANPKIFSILWKPKYYTVFTRTHDLPLSQIR